MSRPLGAQDQIRAVRDMRPSARVYVGLLEDEAPFPWAAWIEWRDGGRPWMVSATGATMPEALAALRRELESPTHPSPPSAADVEYERLEREGMRQ